MTTSKLEIEKFDGKCDFNLWKMNVQDLNDLRISNQI